MKPLASWGDRELLDIGQAGRERREKSYPSPPPDCLGIGLFLADLSDFDFLHASGDFTSQAKATEACPPGETNVCFKFGTLDAHSSLGAGGDPGEPYLDAAFCFFPRNKTSPRLCP